MTLFFFFFFLLRSTCNLPITLGVNVVQQGMKRAFHSGSSHLQRARDFLFFPFFCFSHIPMIWGS